tara:strand:- start:411 stop:731 length:321 start_codon:yes stop_codon:yes gene_type:complete
VIEKTKNFVKKDRKILDTKVSIYILFGHILTNFAYALISGLLLAIIPTKNYLYIGLAYFIFKRFEGVVFKRGGYSSKLGNRYIWPIPSVLGFLFGVWLSELLIKVL